MGEKHSWIIYELTIFSSRRIHDKGNENFNYTHVFYSHPQKENSSMKIHVHKANINDYPCLPLFRY